MGDEIATLEWLNVPDKLSMRKLTAFIILAGQYRSRRLVELLPIVPVAMLANCVISSGKSSNPFSRNHEQLDEHAVRIEQEARLCS